ncbi:MAG: V-type ATPase 116kDa subunit family protein [Paludibacteraceae bacterium]|nr:ATPase V [Bacteroidales bacterium]MDY4148275.1 V-type ATPase 116kDa subunit family protein [Paludibacteraceae bacterium]
MITQMKKYTFLVFHRDYEAFLEQLRAIGVVHITEKAAGATEDTDLQQAIAHAEQLRKTIANGAPDQLLQEKVAIEQRIATTKKEAERMAVWGDFSAERIAQLKQAGYELHYYTCSKSKFTDNLGIVLTTIGATTYFVQVVHSGEVREELPEYCQEQTLNEKSAADLQKDVKGLNGLLVAQNARIELWAKENIPALKAELQTTLQQIDWKRVTLNTDTIADGSLKLLEGFCPIDKEQELNQLLDSQSVYYQEEDPTVEDNTPIKLHNNRFTKMFECLTGMYGWPSYGEFDPTPILGPFFLLFFAICMGDCGYGLLLILIGILISKGKLKIQMFEGLGPIITTLGVGTAVIGFFLGTFFGIDLYAASWIPEALKSMMIKGNVEVAGSSYDIQMVMALCIGVFHICLAMVVKAICYTKRFGFKENISTWGWLLLIVGGLIVLLLGMTHLFSEEVTKWTLIVVAAISALGIYIFNKPGRNPLINIGAGLWDTYNMATGILGDVLSYIRLYALGLAGGMLGGAFNNLAGMVLGDNPTWQWLPFVIILLIGHALNLAMSALGAFVHPLRLSFVEYFKNSGYEGKGTLYKPFAKQ